MEFTPQPPDDRKELPLPVGEYRPTGNEINEYLMFHLQQFFKHHNGT